MTMADYNKTREFAGFLKPKTGAPLNLRQGVVAAIEMGTVQVYFSDNTFAAGGISFLSSYNPRVGDTVWVLKNGPDDIVLGPVILPGGIEEEPWHWVGDTAYGEPAFENGWVNYGTDAFYTYDEAAFFKDPDGFVHLKGLVKNPTAALTESHIFTLPEGYRPDSIIRVPVSASSGGLPARMWGLQVDSDGHVFLSWAGNITTAMKEYVSLCGVVFMAGSDPVHERVHEWTPYGDRSGWSWDFATQLIDPPGQWQRWDGLVRNRGRLSVSGGSAAEFMCYVAERTAKRRWNLLFPTLAVIPGPQFRGIRIDLTPHRRSIQRQTTATDESDITLDGLQWFADIPESYWTDLELLNSWVPYSQGSSNPQWGPPGYMKDGYGHVHLRGLIKNGTTATQTVIAILPVDSRPEGNQVFTSWAADGSTRIDVGSNGEVRLMDTTINNAFLSLDTIHFRANENYTL